MTYTTLLFGLPFMGVVAGVLLAHLLVNRQKVSQALLLAFSGAFLLSVIFFELLPKLFAAEDFTVGYWVIGGILFQIALEYFSKGMEHGHTHPSAQNKYPWLLWLSLGLHAFTEGMPLSNYPQLAWGMFVHKIPITVALFTILKLQSKNWKSLYLPLAGFALVTPLGGMLGARMLLNGTAILLPITGMVVGILLHIATTIIFETSEGHRFNAAKFISILLGFLLGSLL